MIDYELIRKRFHENGSYTEAPEIVSQDMISIMQSMSKIVYASNILPDDTPKTYGVTVNTFGAHGVQMAELLLLHFREHYSKVVGKELVPTYSYTRIYEKGAFLKQHRDRPACQYSMTVNIASSDDSKPWPFFCKTAVEGSKESKIYNDLYTPILYKGEDVSHWREPLEKDRSLHVFLHYVDKNDPDYRKEWYDGRRYVGVN